MDLQFRKMLGYKWVTIIEHIKKLTGKEYSVSYLRKIMNRTEKNKRLIPILEDMGLMEERK
jgi:fibrillarin-like rRNA methylase